MISEWCKLNIKLLEFHIVALLKCCYFACCLLKCCFLSCCSFVFLPFTNQTYADPKLISFSKIRSVNFGSAYSTLEDDLRSLSCLVYAYSLLVITVETITKQLSTMLHANVFTSLPTRVA